ncbi:hypothetical protein HDU93_007585 [Gonapodya sp. JEL0774]|nr:hypothetical protein HDU93_007585 [Gonapodya sp. JEL0774]
MTGTDRALVEAAVESTLVATAQAIAATFGTSSTVKLRIPESSDFLHRACVAAAREIYLNPKLMDNRSDRVASGERQRLAMKALRAIGDAILVTVRDLLPLKDLSSGETSSSGSSSITQDISADGVTTKHSTTTSSCSQSDELPATNDATIHQNDNEEKEQLPPIPPSFWSTYAGSLFGANTPSANDKRSGRGRMSRSRSRNRSKSRSRKRSRNQSMEGSWDTESASSISSNEREGTMRQRKVRSRSRHRITKIAVRRPTPRRAVQLKETPAIDNDNANRPTELQQEASEVQSVHRDSPNEQQKIPDTVLPWDVRLNEAEAEDLREETRPPALELTADFWDVPSSGTGTAVDLEPAALPCPEFNAENEDVRWIMVKKKTALRMSAKSAISAVQDLLGSSAS